MNTITRTPARIDAWMPREIESAPSAGPIVRSSSSTTGIGSEPARRITARSAASWVVKRPVMTPSREMRSRMIGAE